MNPKSKKIVIILSIVFLLVVLIYLKLTGRYIGRILFGLIVVALGVALAYYSANITNMFGRWNWAERYLGGTRQGYILLGFVGIVLGFMIMFGVVKGGGDYKELKFNNHDG